MKRLTVMLLMLAFIPIIAQSTNLSLEEAVNLAKANNTNIKQAEIELKAAKAGFWKEISLPKPNLTASYEFIPKGKGINNYEERSFEISQEFEFPTNYYFKGKIANLQIDAAQTNLQNEIAKVIFDVKNAYYDLLCVKEHLSISLENLNTLKDFSEKSLIKYSSGETSKIEYLTANMQYNEALNDYENCKKELISSKLILTRIMYGNEGSSNTELNLLDTLTFSKIDWLLEELIKAAKLNNINLVEKNIQSKIASTNKTLAYSSFLPELSLGYSKQAMSGNDNFYGVSFGVSIPIWFMFEQRGNIQESNASLDIAVIDLKSTEQELVNELILEHENLSSLQNQIENYRSIILPNTNEILQTALESYEAGETSYMEFILTIQTTLKAKQTYIELLCNYNKSIAKLNYLTGIDF